jgi:hypothetical protein
MATTKKLSGEEQARRFAETARAIGCDEDEAAFDEKLKAVAGQQPKSRPEKRNVAAQPRKSGGRTD